MQREMMGSSECWMEAQLVGTGAVVVTLAMARRVAAARVIFERACMVVVLDGVRLCWGCVAQSNIWKLYIERVNVKRRTDGW
ncbi:hypothetical protein BJY00DRAFT_285522 [Aspergillus carlsbadensis]|nr:hypothetical protein BJY00DRAFT_285522 [Aspergillus carlsbadensis]